MEGFLNVFQIQVFLIHEECLRFLWPNGQKCNSRRLARLDRFYTPNQSRQHKSYYIHEYTVGSDHSLIQLEFSIENNEVRDSASKWNVSHLQIEIPDFLSDKWPVHRLKH